MSGEKYRKPENQLFFQRWKARDPGAWYITLFISMPTVAFYFKTGLLNFVTGAEWYNWFYILPFVYLSWLFCFLLAQLIIGFAKELIEGYANIFKKN